MDRLTRMLTGLVRCVARLLDKQRRDWVHALLAEVDDVPGPSSRLAWLGGGLWLVVREVVMNRIIQALAFAAGAVGLVWIGWPGASTNSATPVILPVWAMDVGFLLILAGYVAGLLVLTSRRVQFTRRVLPAALGIGALTAGVLYALASFRINDTADTAAHSLHRGPVVVYCYLVLACFALAAL